VAIRKMLLTRLQRSAISESGTVPTATVNAQRLRPDHDHADVQAGCRIDLNILEPVHRPADGWRLGAAGCDGR